ncbi:MAG: NAD(P)H-hydrate dehydratase [Candidatus Goldbacteria bacterium]|nr:NAD(P)H-hydrate dehydratase [Candidatus Goldiibacteriota bacterium]
MYLVTASEMKEIDRQTIDKYGIPPSILMENAGINTVSAILNDFGSVAFKKIYVFCGDGNNGGDGFVIARHLKSAGAIVRIIFCGDEKKLSAESLINYEAAKNYGVEIFKISSFENIEPITDDIITSDIIVDALIGTGLKSEVKDLMAKIILFINNLGKYTVAVDVPSGVDSDTGNVMGVAIYANLTVTFGLPKIGITIYPGLAHVGKLIVADINFPPSLLSIPRKNILVTSELIPPLLPFRPPNANKGHFGPILIIGGSKGMGGAVSLAAKAALKTGAGIVTVAVPETLHDSIKASSDEVIVAPLKETDDGFISDDNFKRIIELAEKAKVIVIGPGLGRKKETQQLVFKLLQEIDRPLIIDADGINAVSEDKKHLKNIKKDVIITPHLGEMSRLTGIAIEEIIKDKIKVIKEFIKEYKINVLLKDGRSIVGDVEGNIYINTTGNSGMATPGTGDVLSGIIAALAAHNLPLYQAAIVGNFIHGLSGDLLLNEMSEEGIIAGDIINKIPVAIKKLRNK